MLKSAFTRLREGGQDSARSWLIAAGSCIIYFVCFGTNRSNGVLFKALLDDGRNLTREDASWPFTFSGSVGIFGAPLGGFLGFRFGSKITSIAGIVIYSLGSFACYFSTDIIFLSIFFGVIRGTGMAVATACVPGSINLNFKRHLATAMGIATTGTPLGGLVLPLVIQYCLDIYGLRTNFLILAGLSLCSIVGALMALEQVKPAVAEMEEPSDVKRTKQGLDNSGFDVEKNYDSGMKKDECISEGTAIVTVSETVPLEDYGKAMGTTNTEKKKREDGSLVNNCIAAEDINPEVLCETEQSVPHEKSFQNALKEIFQSRGFYLCMLINVSMATFVGFYSLVIVDYAEDKGIERHLGIHMLTIGAGVEIAGRSLLGWVSDRNFISRIHFLMLALSLTIGSVLTLTFSTSYAALMTFAGLLGLTQGIVISMLNVLLAEYISKANMHLAVSFMRSVIGISYLPRSSIVGYFRDTLGSYNNLFHALTGLLTLSTIACTVESIYRKVIIRKEKKKTRVQ